MLEDKGIVVLAQNLNAVDYVQQACLLAMSVAVTNPNTKISIITNDIVPSEYIKLFDKIIPIPFGDDAKESGWKTENRWKIFHASPYTKTLVMDVDTLILQDISSWWEFFSNYKLFFTSKVYTYRGDETESSYYRRTFKSNNLPNLYSGLHYFEKSDMALEFYQWLELITKNWELFYGKYAKNDYPGRSSIDVSSAIAAKILDCEHEITNSKSTIPYFVHMKPMNQGWQLPKQNWRDCVGVYITRNCDLKIGNYIQKGVFHYTEKEFVTDAIINRYRNLLHV